MSGSVGAYLAQVDWSLRSGQSLYPPSLAPVGIATDLPPTPPPPPGTSATATGAAGAAGERDKQLRTAAGVDAAATSAAKSGAGEAQAGRAGAAAVRSTAAAQAAAIAPATGHPAGVRALVSAMDEKLAAMQRQLSTTQAQNRLLAARMRQLARAYGATGRTGGAGLPARWAGPSGSGLSGLSGISTLASGVSGLASAPSAAVSSLTSPATSLIGSAARPLRQFTSPSRRAAASLLRNAPVGALLPGVANERGLQRNTILAARAISAAFPEIREIGGYRRDRLHWHPNGLAIDVMIPNWNTPAGRALGDRVLQFVMTHGERFGLDNAIWRQTLYEENGSASRMQNLGNPTANHFDHVHIATTGGGYPRGRQMYVL